METETRVRRLLFVLCYLLEVPRSRRILCQNAAGSGRLEQETAQKRHRVEALAKDMNDRMARMLGS